MRHALSSRKPPLTAPTVSSPWPPGAKPERKFRLCGGVSFGAISAKYPPSEFCRRAADFSTSLSPACPQNGTLALYHFLPRLKRKNFPDSGRSLRYFVGFIKQKRGTGLSTILPSVHRQQRELSTIFVGKWITSPTYPHFAGKVLHFSTFSTTTKRSGAFRKIYPILSSNEKIRSVIAGFPHPAFFERRRTSADRLHRLLFGKNAPRGKAAGRVSLQNKNRGNPCFHFISIIILKTRRAFTIKVCLISLPAGTRRTARRKPPRKKSVPRSAAAHLRQNSASQARLQCLAPDFSRNFPFSSTAL